MTFAISWEADEVQAGGFLYFDAITSWNRSYTGQVTKHPVDGGSNVTDHFVKNNPVFTMSAVISGVDISVSTSSLTNELGDTPYNARLAPSAVIVESSDSSLLMKFIPNVVGQFLPDTLPEIVMDDTRGDTTEEMQDILVSLQSGEGFNQITGQFETSIRPVTLYETNGFLALVKKLPAANSFLVVTNIQFREDTESGYALYADITFEQVAFATLKKTQLPQDVKTIIKKKAAPKKSVGKCDSTVKDAASASNSDPQAKKDAVDDSSDKIRTNPVAGGTQ